MPILLTSQKRPTITSERVLLKSKRDLLKSANLSRLTYSLPSPSHAALAPPSSTRSERGALSRHVDDDASSRRSGMYSQKSYMQFFLKKNIYSHKSCTSSKVLFTVDYIYIHPHIYAMQVPDAVACVFKSPLDIDYMHSIHW